MCEIPVCLISLFSVFFFFICLCALMSQLHYKSSLPPSKSLLSGVFFWSILFDNKGMFYAEEEACVDRKKKKTTTKPSRTVGTAAVDYHSHRAGTPV